MSNMLPEPEGESLPHLPLTLITLRLVLQAEEAMTLPRWKGSLLHGGLGRALKSALCNSVCVAGGRCPRADLCPYRAVFAPDAEEGRSDLRGLRDSPRPYAIQPPLEAKTAYQVGDCLPFQLLLAGHASEYLPQLIHAFTTLGEAGLGLDRGRAALTSVVTYDPLNGRSLPLLKDGVLQNQVLTITGADLAAAATTLPSTLTLHFRTPMRIKHEGRFAPLPECHILVRSALRRLSALATYFGTAAWNIPFKEVIEQAQAVRLRTCHTQWVDWSRTSAATGQHMNWGGFVGNATYEAVPAPVRLVLLAGSLVQIGKAVVFGHGAYHITPLPLSQSMISARNSAI
ncbi:MAG: CRISPR system precrRNA processing endoribonuclease RAMP protein Cas6 [Chloroflexota bacterium]|nr:CRISPR system precrRNA processing endoribonuclease RAMP protein Cas6 [Chloroflexota bacterium]